MKLKDFKAKMRKSVFTSEEARRIAWETPPQTLSLQLHQWARAGDLMRLRRGVYGFPGQIQDKTDVARVLYGPAYVSLESALQFYGLLPDAVFAITLVTPKTTRRFKTPMGEFVYHKIRKDLFWGYDPDTLMGDREKTLVDYLYFRSGNLLSEMKFWESLRWQHLEEVDFQKAEAFARRFGVKKVIQLIRSLKEYGEVYGKS